MMRETEVFSTDSRRSGPEVGRPPAPYWANLWETPPSPFRALVIGAILAAWLTWPTIGRPATTARFDTGDGRLSVWNVAWVAHALISDPRHLFDANIFHPHEKTLAYSEANLVAGAMAVPVYAITRNPVAAHNSVVYAAMVLSFFAMWALVRRLTGDDAAALVSATAFTFAPFVAARTAHIQLLMIFVFPVVMLAWHRFLDMPGVRRGIVLGLSLVLAALACGYYGIFAGLAVGLAAVWFGWHRRRLVRYWVGLLAAVVVAVGLVAPVLQPYLELRDRAGVRQSADVEELRRYSADWRAYLTSPSRTHEWIHERIGLGREVLFPGFTLTALMLVGLAAIRRSGSADLKVGAASDASRTDTDPVGRATSVNVLFYALLGVLAVWASFGPDAGLYTWLDGALPIMSFLRAPARLGIVVVFAMAVVAGFVLARLLPQRRRSALALVLTLIVAVDVSAAPWPLVPVPRLPAAYVRLQQLPRAPVVELHFPYRSGELYPHTTYMFWSAWHWHPLVNGYSDFIPADFRKIAGPINGFPDPTSLEIMRVRDVRYVLIHWNTYDDAGRVEMRNRFGPYTDSIRLLLDDGEVSLYEIVSYPPRR